MSQTTEEVKQIARNGLTIVQALRDEIRLKIHLAGMDAKDEWSKLEPKITEAEKLAGEANSALLEHLLSRLKSLNALIDGG